MADHDHERDDTPRVKGAERDRRRDADRRRQVVALPVIEHGHRAGRASDERRIARVVKAARRRAR
jgi:hypothetical protein